MVLVMVGQLIDGQDSKSVCSVPCFVSRSLDASCVRITDAIGGLR